MLRCSTASCKQLDSPRKRPAVAGRPRIPAQTVAVAADGAAAVADDVAVVAAAADAG